MAKEKTRLEIVQAAAQQHRQKANENYENYQTTGGPGSTPSITSTTALLPLWRSIRLRSRSGSMLPTSKTFWRTSPQMPLPPRRCLMPTGLKPWTSWPLIWW